MRSCHQSPIATLLLCTLLLWGASAASPPCDFPAIFNFGDSNSDTGGLSSAFGPAPPPNGETFFGRPAGRFSDGRLVIDFIAKSLGLPHLHAYLDSIGSNFSHGANFATAGSTIRPENQTLSQSGFSPFSLDVQTWQFSQFKSRSQLVDTLGAVFTNLLPKEDLFPRALYTLDIGQNDLTSSYFRGMTTEEVKACIPDIINKFTIVVKSLYGEGGRSFWIHNTGPLGCLPYVLERIPLTASQVDEFGCGIPFNEVAQQFNTQLKQTVAELRRELPLAAITYVDVYSVKHSLITQAKKHGFEHPLVVCCGHGGKYNFNVQVGCGGKIVVNGTEVLIGSCRNPLKRIVWDGVHYTEAANNWVFDQIVEGAFSEPPIPLRMACHNQAPSVCRNKNCYTK